MSSSIKKINVNNNPYKKNTIIKLLQKICFGSGIACLANTEFFNLYYTVPICLFLYFYLSNKFLFYIVGFYVASQFDVSGGFTAGVLFALGFNLQNTLSYLLVQKRILYISMVCFFFSMLLLYSQLIDIPFLNQKWLFDAGVALVIWFGISILMSNNNYCESSAKESDYK
ncbi:hypothetical protein [Candidatus Cytomitobacter primus]|uniref:Rod shape-determining protein MreD n=1 Tax=Candidatus Cytomitobacter primus TaxID=2066024 RepID=A0A5C0UHY5_9PROT|nr:hypothetical protein [Candidatus Cytomitobacter primus]QEK38554.1 hypothetical protein FZC34_01355 [Candidatus Cytomitobacter primus]